MRRQKEQKCFRALRHYANRLKNLAEDEEIKVGNDILKDDLLMDAKETEQLRENLKNPEVSHQSFEQNKEIVCCALICYINDLQNSKNIVRNKLAGANPSFQEVDKEILAATDAENVICKKNLFD